MPDSASEARTPRLDRPRSRSDDHSIGGDVAAPIHLDGILREPTVYADGEEVDLPEA